MGNLRGGTHIDYKKHHERYLAQKESHHAYYIANRSKILKQVKAWQAKNLERFRKLRDDWRERVQHKHRFRAIQVEINEIKAITPCTDCGILWPPFVTDYDHITGTKTADVSAMIRRGIKFETILAEIEKCELVCANCHRIRTATRLLHI